MDPTEGPNKSLQEKTPEPRKGQEEPRQGQGSTVKVCGHQIKLDNRGICCKVTNTKPDQPSRLDFLVGAAFDLADGDDKKKI